MNIAYENLDLIPKLFTEVISLKSEIQKLKTEKSNIKSAKDVIQFLEIGRTTLHNLIKSNKLKEGVHYYFNSPFRY